MGITLSNEDLEFIALLGPAERERIGITEEVLKALSPQQLLIINEENILSDKEDYKLFNQRRGEGYMLEFTD